MADKITGKVRVRLGKDDKLILQVQVEETSYSYSSIDRYNVWRDAKIEDLTTMDIKDL